MTKHHALLGFGATAMLGLAAVASFTSHNASQTSTNGVRPFNGGEQIQTSSPENRDQADTILPGPQARTMLTPKLAEQEDGDGDGETQDDS